MITKQITINMATVAPCPTNCTADDLLGLPADNCNTGFRRDTPSRLLMYNCDITFPTGTKAAVGAAVKVMLASGTMVRTMPLANVVFEDPTYDELQLDDCSSPESLIVNRALSFEDRYGIDLSTVSPYTETKFFDYDFWLNKVQAQKNIRYALEYCSGDVRVIPFGATIRGFIDYLKAQTAGGKSTETKKFRLLFNGDYINFENTPVMNTVDAGIN